MAGYPFIKFYPTDWRSEPRLKVVSRAARSLWLDMICLIHEGGEGRLHIDGRKPTDKELAAILGDNPRTFRKLQKELEDAGVFDRDKDGFVCSRRIIRDRIKAERDRKNGRKGGNPWLKTAKNSVEGVNPQDKAIFQKPEARGRDIAKKKLYPYPGNQNKNRGHHIRHKSEQWDAWNRHLAAIGKPELENKPSSEGWGAFMPTRWPPKIKMKEKVG